MVTDRGVAFRPPAGSLERPAFQPIARIFAATGLLGSPSPIHLSPRITTGGCARSNRWYTDPGVIYRVRLVDRTWIPIPDIELQVTSSIDILKT